MELQNNSTIIGDKDQILQVVLKKNDSIVLQKKNLYYMSGPTLEETQYSKKKSSKDEKILSLGKRVNDCNLIRLRNVENNFKYVGLFNSGKIMKIYPALYYDLFIRYDCLLAFSDNIDLIDVDSTKQEIEKFHRSDNILNINHKFYMVLSEKNRGKDLEQFSITDYPSFKECLYLSNENLLIEKRLGNGETIVIRNNSLICFEKTVKFQSIGPEIKYKVINKSEYFEVTGPGLLIFEISNQRTREFKLLRNLRLIGLLTITLIALGLINYFLEDKIRG